mmetsp:Transcript_28257/g.70143  ORF Transcript_28257/g.70143 Transcript_28257/m.70143 type:complete len:310 (-) Transcript_28257:101-1030(-)
MQRAEQLPHIAAAADLLPAAVLPPHEQQLLATPPAEGRVHAAVPIAAHKLAAYGHGVQQQLLLSSPLADRPQHRQLRVHVRLLVGHTADPCLDRLGGRIQRLGAALLALHKLLLLLLQLDQLVFLRLGAQLRLCEHAGLSALLLEQDPLLAPHLGRDLDALVQVGAHCLALRHAVRQPHQQLQPQLRAQGWPLRRIECLHDLIAVARVVQLLEEGVDLEQLAQQRRPQQRQQRLSQRFRPRPPAVQPIDVACDRLHHRGMQRRDEGVVDRVRTRDPTHERVQGHAEREQLVRHAKGAERIPHHEELWHT